MGAPALGPDVVSRMIGRRGIDARDRLTPREPEVLGLMAEGRSNRGIAQTLVVTEDAVEKHVTTSCASSTSPGPPPTIAASWRCSPSCAASTPMGFTNASLSMCSGATPLAAPSVNAPCACTTWYKVTPPP